MTTEDLDLGRVIGRSQLQVVRVDSRDVNGDPVHVTMLAGPYDATAGNAERAWVARDEIAARHPEVPDRDIRVVQVFESEIDLIAITRKHR